MILEILLSSLGLLSYYDIINWKITIPIVFVIYWLPKCLFIHMLADHVTPSIMTHYRSTTTVALTFDDLPYGSHEKIINILDQYDMKATFFVISDQINEDNIQILIKAVQNGHQLANHGKTNSMHACKFMNVLEIEIDDCDKKIREIYQRAGVAIPTNMYYRPGCGLFHPRMISLAKKKNYRLVLGSVYPNDPVTSLWYLNYCYLIWHIKAGDIVILHDRSWTVPLLERLLPWLRKNRLESVTLDQAFQESQSKN